MSRLTRDETTELVLRDQILRNVRGQGNIHFPCSADHEQDWQPYPVDPYSAICNDHTCNTTGSTIGEGGDTATSSPGRSPKQPLLGIELHGRQACPEFIAFDQGVGQICPRWRLIPCRFLPKRGQICYIPAPPPNRYTYRRKKLCKNAGGSFPASSLSLF